MAGYDMLEVTREKVTAATYQDEHTKVSRPLMALAMHGASVM